MAEGMTERERLHKKINQQNFELVVDINKCSKEFLLKYLDKFFIAGLRRAEEIAACMHPEPEPIQHNTSQMYWMECGIFEAVKNTVKAIRAEREKLEGEQ